MQPVPTQSKHHPLLYQILGVSFPGFTSPAASHAGHKPSLISLTLGHLTLLQRADAPNDKKSPLGTCESNIKPPPVSQKSNLSRRIVPHGGKNDHLLLSTLKSVHSLDVDRLQLQPSMVPQRVRKPSATLLIRVKEARQ